MGLIKETTTEKYARSAFQVNVSCPVVAILLRSKIDPSGRRMLETSMFADLLQSVNEIELPVEGQIVYLLFIN